MRSRGKSRLCFEFAVEVIRSKKEAKKTSGLFYHVWILLLFVFAAEIQWAHAGIRSRSREVIERSREVRGRKHYSERESAEIVTVSYRRDSYCNCRVSTQWAPLRGSGKAGNFTQIELKYISGVRNFIFRRQFCRQNNHLNKKFLTVQTIVFDHENAVHKAEPQDSRPKFIIFRTKEKFPWS